MTRIPSIEKTDDYIFRIEIEKGQPRPLDPADMLTFEHFVEPTGPLHSIDFVTFRDGARATDLEFLAFEHHGVSKLALFRLKFFERNHVATDHSYLVTVIVRYLV